MPEFQPFADVADIPSLGQSTKTVSAIFDTVVPEGEHPGGWEGGGESLLREQLDGFLDWATPILEVAALVVDKAAHVGFGQPFHMLDHAGRTQILAAALATERAAGSNAPRGDTPIDADSVMVLRGCGPKGYPGMPEVSNMPLPKKLLEQGVRDLVRTGDLISLDVEARRLDLEVSPDELVARTPNEATVAGFANPRRGWERLYVDHVQQADTGADLDFLVGSSGSKVSRESH